MTKLTKAMHSTNNGKSCGLDEIPDEGHSQRLWYTRSKSKRHHDSIQ